MPIQIKKLDPIRKYFSNGAGKKSLLYLGIVIGAFVLVLVLIWYFSRPSEIPETFVPEKPLREQVIEQQLEELEELRGETQPLTEEEIEKQLEELNKLRSQ